MSLTFQEPKYDIEASDFRCRSCQAEVPCEAPFYSAVVFESESFRRQSYCLGCWGGGVLQVFAFWRSRRPPLPVEKPRRVRFDPSIVLEFFRRLPPAAGAEGPSQREADEVRFVLALLLVRTKALRLGASFVREGAEWLQLTEKDPPESVHHVRNPELTDDQIERVKVRIGDLLSMQV